MSSDKNAGQNNDIKIGNKSFERVGQFSYLGMTLKNRNSFYEGTKRLKSGSACYRCRISCLLFAIKKCKD